MKGIDLHTLTVAGAILLVDRTNAALTLKDGRPSTGAVEDVIASCTDAPETPVDVSAAARDAAWDVVAAVLRGDVTDDGAGDSVSRRVLAKRLKLRPTEAERKAGYDLPESLVEAIADDGDAWVVVTARGGKHRIPKADLG